ncbi:MAG: hypothetical protein WCJ58_02300 [bacterium]
MNENGYVVNPNPAPVSNHASKKRRAGNTKLVVVLIILIILLIGALAGSIYLLKKEKDKIADPTTVATEELARMKEKIGKHIVLPFDKEAQLATVLDVKKLQEENAEFYKNAKNGDKLLIYKDRAILYDPIKDIILNVAPVVDTGSNTTTDTNTNTTTDSTVTTTPTVTVNVSPTNTVVPTK